MSAERRPLVFLGLVAVSSIPLFVLGAVAGGMRVGAMYLPPSAVMFVVPVIVATALTRWHSGGAAAAGLLKRAVDRPAAPLRWYALAVLLVSVIAVVSTAWARWAEQPAAALPLSLTAVPVLLVVSAIAATCEELGWTAYATEPLQQRFGMLRTGLGLGVYWAAWHLIPLLQAGHPATWIAGWFLGTVALRVLIVWLHVRTGYGVSAAILMHTMVNVIAVYTPGYDRPISTITTGVVTAAVAAAVVCFGWLRARDQRSCEYRRGERVQAQRTGGPG
ncbi:type II CAAX endopeptidase family protein [Nocardia sp. NPDC049707]|uniref:CPBP family intramembrane glutamic endopeptidase n=1 Tax=Nocardia sp. NPDC049707 TaxID=3154735 RepID=UPI00342795AE